MSNSLDQLFSTCVSQARVILPKFRQLASSEIQLTDVAYKESQRLETLGTDITAGAEQGLLDNSVLAMHKAHEGLKANLLISPEFVQITDPDFTVLLADATPRELKGFLATGALSLNDVKDLHDALVRVTAVLLDKTKNTSNSEFRAKAFERAVNASNAAAKLNILLASFSENQNRTKLL